MVERSGYSPKPLPMIMLEGNNVEKQLEETRGLFLPKGTKALLIVHLVNRYDRNLGPAILTRDVKGAIDESIFTGEYHGLPPTAIRMNVALDSEARRKKTSKIKYKFTRDYNPEVNAINKQLAADFLAERQDDLEFFNIDPDTVRKVSLQVAIDRPLSQAALKLLE